MPLSITQLKQKKKALYKKCEKQNQHYIRQISKIRIEADCGPEGKKLDQNCPEIIIHTSIEKLIYQ